MGLPFSGLRPILRDYLIKSLLQASEEYYASGWYHDFEYLAWEDLERYFPPNEARRLKMIAEAIDGWPTWTDEEVRIIPLATWKERYTLWYTRNRWHGLGTIWERMSI